MDGDKAQTTGRTTEEVMTPEGDRRFIGDMTAFNWYASLDEAATAWGQVLECAKEHGFEILEGSIANAREREPQESVHFGSTAPYRNTRAETTWGSMAGEMTSQRREAGAEAHSR